MEKQVSESMINGLRFRWKTQHPADLAYLSEPPYTWLSESHAVQILGTCFFNFETDFEKCCIRIAKEGEFYNLSTWFYWEVHILTYWTYYRCFNFGNKEIKHVSYEEAIPIFNFIIQSYVLPKFEDGEWLKFLSVEELHDLVEKGEITKADFWNALVDESDCKSCCDVGFDFKFGNFYCTWGCVEGTRDGFCPYRRCGKWTPRSEISDEDYS